MSNKALSNKVLTTSRKNDWVASLREQSNVKLEAVTTQQKFTGKSWSSRALDGELRGQAFLL